jgi:hypothetical protein
MSGSLDECVHEREEAVSSDSFSTQYVVALRRLKRQLDGGRSEGDALAMARLRVDIAGTGFTVLDRVYADIQKSFEAVGGSCGNVLVSLAMLQHSVLPVLAIGYDKVGEWLVSQFAKAGADTRYISLRCGQSSPVLAQQVDMASGQHDMVQLCLSPHPCLQGHGQRQP